MTGITKTPTTPKLHAKRATFLDGKVNRVHVIDKIEKMHKMLRIRLYLAVLSSMIPTTNELTTPQNIKVAPKMLLSIEVYSYG